VAVLLALTVPALAVAGPTLYDLQHSSVLRQRLPPHLREATGPSTIPKSPDRSHQEPSKQPGDKDATSAGPSGASDTTGTDGKAGKQ
jgi:hypothetical protein